MDKERKARPILFNAEMVNAILDGSKAQTRRIIKPQPEGMDCSSGSVCQHLAGFGVVKNMRSVLCPYGEIGDLLWVRETFRLHGGTDECGCGGDACWCQSEGSPVYRATQDNNDGEKWKPSIFMPKWASRITLEITDVRVERLDDISEEDVKSEGVQQLNSPTKREAFMHLWREIYGIQSWRDDPWVWVIEFKTHKKNFEAML